MQAFSLSAQFARESAMLKLPEERRRWGKSKGAEGGGEREEKTPALEHCENEKHPLIHEETQRACTVSIPEGSIQFLIIFL